MRSGEHGGAPQFYQAGDDLIVYDLITRQPVTTFDAEGNVVDQMHQIGDAKLHFKDDAVVRLLQDGRRVHLEGLTGQLPWRVPERFTEEIPRYLERHQVRPGLTGWAQVNDLRGGEAFADRAMYDIYYVENWSLALDLKILILTGARVFFQRRAY